MRLLGRAVSWGSNAMGGDAGASMRALRPSSRRGSWGSDETGWSAAGQSISTGGPALIGMYTSGQRRRGTGSVTTAWSYKTRDFEGYGYDGEEEESSAGGIGTSVHGSTRRPRAMEDITPTEETWDVSEEPSPMIRVKTLDDVPRSIPLPDSPMSSLHHDAPLPQTSAAPTAAPVTVV